MKLVWTHAAVRDLQEARAHIADDGPGAAALVASRTLASVGRLEDMPSLGRSGRVAGTRELAVPQTSYLLVYRLSDERIEMLRVLHGRRTWPQ
jgi:addiction module RelE/StbE family toxin